MTTCILSTAIERYQAAIANLEKAKETISPKDIQAVLAARQTAYNALNEGLHAAASKPFTACPTEASPKPRIPYRKLANTVEELDLRLNQQAEVIQRASGLSSQQIEYLFADERRWKSPEYNVPWHDHFDILWQFLSVVCFGFSTVLLLDIIKRSLTGGVDVGSGAAALSATLISMLSGGGLLTKFGQEKTGEIFKKLRIPDNLWDEARCLISVSFTLLLLGLWCLLPSFAGLYVKAAESADNLARQEDYYHRAIALKPGSVEAYLGLARLYANQHDLDQALPAFKSAYNVVQKRDPVKACEAAESISQIFLDKGEYSKADRWLTKSVEIRKADIQQRRDLCKQQLALIKNLGRVYLLSENERKPHEAIRWFKLGLSNISEQDRLERAKAQYDMQVHLARAQLSADLLKDAESTLEEAIELDQEEVAFRPEEQRAAAHCLLAQVLEERQSDGHSISSNTVMNRWNLCSRFVRSEIADEVNWQQLASKRLTAIKQRTQPIVGGNSNEIRTEVQATQVNNPADRVALNRD